MPSIKIYPPTKLPSSDLSETQFHMWQEELEVYISQDPDFKIFLPDQLYGEWTCFEEDRNRIPALKARDIIVARNNRNGENITEEEALEANDENWTKSEPA